jgi:hypothetical protein
MAMIPAPSPCLLGGLAFSDKVTRPDQNSRWRVFDWRGPGSDQGRVPRILAPARLSKQMQKRVSFWHRSLSSGREGPCDIFGSVAVKSAGGRGPYGPGGTEGPNNETGVIG